MPLPTGNASRRAARARLARWTVLAALALLAAALVAMWFFAEPLLRRFDHRVDIARTSLFSTLRKQHGIELYASLDERMPLDSITGLPLLGSGAVRVPGVFGSARRFDGLPGENLVAPRQRWSPFAHRSFTLAFWLTLLPQDAPLVETRLTWDRGQDTGIGLRIADGRLEATIGDQTGIHVLTAPVPPPGRPVYIAFAVGSERATLYVEGKPCDSCDITPPFTLNAHYLAFGTDGHYPPLMDVDEWTVWRRSLDPSEVARIASSRRPIPALLEPRLSASLRRREWLAAFFRSLLATLGALRPSVSAPAVLNPNLPVLELHLSGDDRRHFRAAHLEALNSGFRTSRGADRRHVQATWKDRSERISAWLDETVPSLPQSSRPAFVLFSTNHLFGSGSGLVRLFPPEQFGDRRPDAARPLPLDPSILVRFHLDGDFLGLYCLVPFESPAPPWFANGPRDLARPDRLHFASPAPGLAAGASLSGQECETAWRDMLALLATDPGFPLRPFDADLLARRHDMEKKALRLPDPAPPPSPVLGTNDLPSSLPSLHLFFGRPLDKLYRTDFACLFVPAGKDADSVWFSGSGGTAGAKLRGNTSFVDARRRSIGLKFNAPVSLPDVPVPVRHLILLSGYADLSRLRNAFAFDVFRAMSPADAIRATPLFWANIFVNGAYTGVWECCPRTQDVASEPFSALYKVRTTGLWTSPWVSAEILDRVDSPAVATSDPYAPLRDIVRFVAESSPSDFATTAPDLFDIDELVDFFLLFNFTDNNDGRVTNQFIGRRVSDGRWIFLPWDYDQTFRPALAGTPLDTRLLTSPLFVRLFNELPGFKERIALRWQNLRSGPLSDEVIDAWLDAHSALLAPSMAEDYAVLPPVGHSGDYLSAVSSLRSRIHDRLSHLDHFSADLLK